MTIHYHVIRYMDSLAITGTAPGMSSIFIDVSAVKNQSNSADFSSADWKSAYWNDMIMNGVHPVLPFIIISPLDTGFSLH